MVLPRLAAVTVSHSVVRARALGVLAYEMVVGVPPFGLRDKTEKAAGADAGADTAADTDTAATLKARILAGVKGVDWSAAVFKTAEGSVLQDLIKYGCRLTPSAATKFAL